VTAITLYADAPRMVAALAEFHWIYLPLILGCALFNYLVRFIKWQYYLRCLKIELPWMKSLLIFFAGLSMVLTPGKVGEILKSYLLKRETGVAVSRTSSIIVAERLTDGIAMLGLTATGLILYHVGWEILLILLVASLACVILIQNRSLALGLLSFGERLPVVSRIAHLIRAFYESAYTLLRWRSLLLAIANGVVSWAGECAALYFVYVGLGMEGNLDLFLKSTFILAASSLIGSATGIPGGLGSADGSMLGLSRLLVSPSAALGGAATLLIRLCTLWFGLLLGVIALLIYRFIERDKHWGEWQQKNDTMPFGQMSESPLLAEQATVSRRENG
jgi:uncharacterized protein (TIRG00374 family)